MTNAFQTVYTCLLHTKELALLTSFLSGLTLQLQVDIFGWYWVQAGVGFETNGFPQRNELRNTVIVKAASTTSGKMHTG